MLRCDFMRKMRLAIAAILLLALLLFTTSGAFLVVDKPRRADVMVVLAGETDIRPTHALNLLRQGFAPKLLLDVPIAAKIFNTQMIQIAQNYVDALPEHQNIQICPIAGLSTKAEAQDVGACLEKLPAKHILLVTSDYHTRRALSILSHEMPGHDFSVAAATDPTQFGRSWWTHRQWAKINLDEWMKLVWWEAVDRWRK
jgi:uncharacterized SAM-binding protein YcdF (DUF218 family)